MIWAICAGLSCLWLFLMATVTTLHGWEHLPLISAIILAYFQIRQRDGKVILVSKIGKPMRRLH